LDHARSLEDYLIESRAITEASLTPHLT